MSVKKKAKVVKAELSKQELGKVAGGLVGHKNTTTGTGISSLNQPPNK